MQHTESCLKYQARLKRAHDEYVAKWPKYCTSCGGFGEVHWYENASPLGSGENWPMECGDVCEVCSGDGKCPRCGEQAWNNDELETWDTPCPHCGWKPGDDGCPDLWDGMCGCYEEQAEEFFNDYPPD